MKNLFNGSRIAIEEENRIYVQGDYTPWHNEDEDCIEGQDCPLVYKNLELILIDENGLWLEQKTDKSLLEDTTWCLYETDCTGVKENYLDAEVLKKELCIEEEKVKEEWTTLTCSLCGQRFLYHTSNECKCSCGATLNLFPDDVKILLAPTLEIAKTIDADITIEAEYGDETIKGTLYTSAHHGKNQGNPAPCNDDNIPIILEGTILLSHLDLDSIIGCMRALGIVLDERLSMLVNAIEYIDVNGPHHLYKYGWQTKMFLNAYWAWNFSKGRQERITELTDVRQQVLETINVIEEIILQMAGVGKNEIDYINDGKKWAENVQKETESKLKKETKYYRLFSTDRVFCGASYYSPQENTIIPAIISYNEKFKAITLSFEDSGKKFKADEIMKELFGPGAGGKSGIAGTPRGIEFTFEDTRKVISKLNSLYMNCQCQNCFNTFDTDVNSCPVCGSPDIWYGR